MTGQAHRLASEVIVKGHLVFAHGGQEQQCNSWPLPCHAPLGLIGLPRVSIERCSPLCSVSLPLTGLTIWDEKR
jgi:hypothetical protein